MEAIAFIYLISVENRMNRVLPGWEGKLETKTAI